MLRTLCSHCPAYALPIIGIGGDNSYGTLILLSVVGLRCIDISMHRYFNASLHATLKWYAFTQYVRPHRLSVTSNKHKPELTTVTTVLQNAHYPVSRRRVDASALNFANSGTTERPRPRQYQRRLVPYLQPPRFQPSGNRSGDTSDSNTGRYVMVSYLNNKTLLF